MKLSYKLRMAAASAESELLSKRYETCQDQMLPVWVFRDFRKVQTMSQDRTFVWKKPLKAA